MAMEGPSDSLATLLGWGKSLGAAKAIGLKIADVMIERADRTIEKAIRQTSNNGEVLCRPRQRWAHLVQLGGFARHLDPRNPRFHEDLEIGRRHCGRIVE
jgi:hypothetical protein